MSQELAAISPAWAWQPYEPSTAQPWDIRRAAHVYRRAGFAANWETLQAAVKRDPQELVSEIVAAREPDNFRQDMSDLATTVLAGGDPRSLSHWWLYRLQHTSAPLVEKMALCWHGHFATSAAKVTNANLMYRQNRIFRTHALADFRQLAQAIARDPAMLIYLDSDSNRKSHPNENFAREVMELFCLGEGNYSEQDIRQLARCFTGWEVRNDKFRFNRFQHDTGKKMIFGESGKFTGENGVDLVVSHPAAPRFIVTKLARYFILDEPTLPPTLLEPLAKELRDNEMVIGPTVERMLSSNLFHSAWSLGRKIRSPIELAVGLLRGLDGTSNAEMLANELENLDQRLFFPPNVKGWDGGRTWINSATLLGRANFVRRLLDSDKTRFAKGKLPAMFEKHGIQGAKDRVNWLLDMLLAVAVPTTVRQRLVELYNKSNGNAEVACRSVVHTLSTLPEFQLS
ncbi:MAG: hypothetical protein ACI9G1_001377 [Pirellulaceae bacterium]|jgi:uncharacterized protein (DUF1800 family)